MTAVCAVWVGYHTAPWLPHCCVSLASPSSAAADTRRSRRPRGSSRRTSPVTFRTTSPSPTCEWTFPSSEWQPSNLTLTLPAVGFSSRAAVSYSEDLGSFVTMNFDCFHSPSPSAFNISSMSSTVWPPFSSSTASCCWRRASTPQALPSKPSESSGAPCVAAASAPRWEGPEWDK